MNIMKRSLLFALTTAVLPLLLSSPVWAGALSQQADQPPFGFSVYGNAKGTKLSGPVTVVFNITSFPMVSDLSVIVRLRQGNDNSLETIALHIGGPFDLTEAGTIQTAILGALEEPISQLFFDSSPVTILLKEFENEKSLSQASDVDGDNMEEQVTVADIVLAVQLK